MGKALSKPHKVFRGTLLCVLLLSFAFFATIVTLRVNRAAHWYVVKNYYPQILLVDAYKDLTKSYFQSDEEQYKTANSLLRRGIYSYAYSGAGLVIMKDLADKGDVRAQTSYGDLLMRGLGVDKNNAAAFVPEKDERIKQARYYYRMAANEDYEPARARLAEMNIQKARLDHIKSLESTKD